LFITKDRAPLGKNQKNHQRIKSSRCNWPSRYSCYRWQISRTSDSPIEEPWPVRIQAQQPSYSHQGIQVRQWFDCGVERSHGCLILNSNGCK
jgi:hypothetical protein